jgi:excisionase family DNA binding protein
VAPGLAPEGRLLTVSEVADLLRINKSTVYRMAKQGRLPATRVGRQWRFRKSVLDRLLEPT